MTRTRRRAGYKMIGNVYRLLYDVKTKGGIQFRAGELLVCSSYANNRGRRLETIDRREVVGVLEWQTELVAEYNYLLVSVAEPWAHVDPVWQTQADKVRPLTSNC